jgi:hypothetical protein
MELLIQTGGRVRCLYGETLDLNLLGRLSIQRGSHVEPNVAGQWTADLSPVDGPKLGPFATRSEALSAEEKWLLEHWLLPNA